MKQLHIKDATFLHPVPGLEHTWYYALNYVHGDLYEAEEVFRAGEPVEGRSLYLVRYPDGTVFQPVQKVPGTYPGEPYGEAGTIYIPYVKFEQGILEILAFCCDSGETGPFVQISLNEVKDCYNLAVTGSPVCLIRQGAGDEAEMIWPEKWHVKLAPNEVFVCRDGNDLYFSRWFEDPEYREETVVRNRAGDTLHVYNGDVFRMPDGQLWILDGEKEET